MKEITRAELGTMPGQLEIDMCKFLMNRNLTSKTTRRELGKAALGNVTAINRVLRIWDILRVAKFETVVGDRIITLTSRGRKYVPAVSAQTVSRSC